MNQSNRKLRQPVTVANPRRTGAMWTLARLAGFVCTALVLVASITGFALYAHYARGLPPIIPFEDHTFEGVTTFYADDGEVIGELWEERRILLPYEQIPRRLILSFLAVEDKRFFSHEGVDLRGIARAALTNLRAGGVVEGGSTITQQLAKQTLGREKSLARKVREAIFARRLEDRYTKEQILLLYLNRIYLGHNSYGVQAAAQNYFRKNVWELSLGEMAMIAGLPQSPSRVNPYVNMEASRRRQSEVLDRMVAAGFATEEQAREAAAEPLVVHPLTDDFATKVPTFVEHVRQQLNDLAGEGWIARGLAVHTTANVELGLLAERALQDGLYALDRKQGFRGPLLRVPDAAARDGLLDRIAAAFQGAPGIGNVTPAIVAAASNKGVEVLLTRDARGFVPREDLDWVGPYTEFPLEDTYVRQNGVRVPVKRRNDAGTVSFKPKAPDLAKVFRPGDVVLVRVVEEPHGKQAKKATPTPERHVRLELLQLPKVEGAFVAFDPDSGQVEAMVGGYDFERSEVNRVFALRQNGSTMKPLVYSLAYDLGLPPSTLFSGAPFTLDGYNPTGERAVADMPLWDALTKSENSVSLRVLQYVLAHAPKERYQEWGERFGLTEPLHGYPSEVLGMDQTLWDMTGAYARFARHGRYEPRKVLRKVTDRDGKVLHRELSLADAANDTRDVLDALFDHVGHERVQAIDPATAYITSANLHEVTMRGTAARVGKELGHEAAGKTGTLPYDVWFIGYTDHLVGGAWIGSDRRERVLGRSKKSNLVYGGDTALPVWLDFMKGAHAKRPKSGFVERVPDSVELVRIDPTTGYLAREGGQLVPHRRGTAPRRTSPLDVSPEFVESHERDF